MDSFAVLADPTRREIVEILMTGPQDAGTLAGRFDVSRPAVSRHLKVLRESGFVDVEPVAQRRVYHLRPEPIAELEVWIKRSRKLWGKRLDALVRHIEEEQ